MGWKGIDGRCFTRDGFDAYVKRQKLTGFHPKFVVLHNTAVPTFADWHKHSGTARMKGLEHYYRDEQGWSAGPHLFIADDFIWTFTRLNTSGVHSPSWNHMSWGVEMVGDYDSEQFNPNVRLNTIRALAALHRAANLDPGTLKFHKEDPKTTHRDCPGKNVAKGDIIASVKRYMAFTQMIEDATKLIPRVLGMPT